MHAGAARLGLGGGRPASRARFTMARMRPHPIHAAPPPLSCSTIIVKNEALFDYVEAQQAQQAQQAGQQAQQAGQQAQQAQNAGRLTGQPAGHAGGQAQSCSEQQLEVPRGAASGACCCATAAAASGQGAPWQHGAEQGQQGREAAQLAGGEALREQGSGGSGAAEEPAAGPAGSWDCQPGQAPAPAAGNAGAALAQIAQLCELYRCAPPAAASMPGAWHLKVWVEGCYPRGAGAGASHLQGELLGTRGPLRRALAACAAAAGTPTSPAPSGMGTRRGSEGSGPGALGSRGRPRNSRSPWRERHCSERSRQRRRPPVVADLSLAAASTRCH